MTFNLSLDLGGDSLKIAYAYLDEDGNKKYGKITASDSLVRVAFPAIAFFDDENDCWVYGNMVDRQQNASFVKVVKIKDLLSLLLSKNNAPFYEGHEFPKFFFPRNANAFDNFDRAIEEGKTFATVLSPKDVCQNFFHYVKTVVDQRKKALEEKHSIKFDDSINISVIYPPKATKPYINELSRLVTEAFGQEPSKVISSTKALGTYVKHTKNMGGNYNLLVFDMGEEDISVSKMLITNSGDVLVDGVEGHMDPIHIGGINIDYAIAEYVENDIRERDTVGTPPANSSSGGHIYEDALVTKQYLFMKGIKKAKVILSRPFDEESVFLNGAPIGIFYEIFVQKRLTHDQISKAIGTADNTGVAKEILDYITNELSKPLNTHLTSNMDVVKSNLLYDYGFVVLSGGLSDTFSLREYIEDNLRNTFPLIKVLDLQTDGDAEDEFSILPNESAAYAASVGGAFIALYDEDIKTALSFSYGTWVDVDGNRCLDIFIDRGQILSNHNTFTIEYGFSGTVEGERLYSTVVTSQDIINGSFRGRRLDIRTSDKGKRYLYIGEEHNDSYRDSIKDLFKLQTVAGGDDAKICALYNGQEIYQICENCSKKTDFITVVQGINVDDNGRITPTYNVHSKESSHLLRIYTGQSKDNKYYDSIAATKIEIQGPQISAKAHEG